MTQLFAMKPDTSDLIEEPVTYTLKAVLIQTDNIIRRLNKEITRSKR